MRLTVINKLFLLFLFCFCFFNAACGQTETNKIKLSNEYARKAFESRQKGNLESAVQEQSKAVELNPNDGKLLTVLASIYISLYEQNKLKDDLQKAEIILKKALELEPGDAVGHDMLAGVFDLLGKKKEALEESEKVVKLQPGNLQSLTNLGSAQNGVGDSQSARETFKKVLQKNPNYAYALYNYAELELEAGNRAKAIELFERGGKAGAVSDNENNTKYIEICRKRLEELKSQKAKTASPK
jgi:Tfp pilus assembly protein PilF